jgi:mono/diheme cytochrome c family protein
LPGVHHAWDQPVRAVTIALPFLLCAAPVAAQQDAARPDQVTESAIERGRRLYFGSGGCNSCHGPGATGDTVAPPLTGALWFNGPGTYDWLVLHITRGVPAHKSMAGVAMPARGVSGLSDAQVRDVAAYVWAITHPPALTAGDGDK